MKKALLALCLVLAVPAFAARLPDKAVQNIAANSQKTCMNQARQAGNNGAHCAAWASCYGSEIQKSTSLEEMMAADKLINAGKRPAPAFMKKMVQAAQTCMARAAKK